MASKVTEKNSLHELFCIQCVQFNAYLFFAKIPPLGNHRKTIYSQRKPYKFMWCEYECFLMKVSSFYYRFCSHLVNANTNEVGNGRGIKNWLINKIQLIESIFIPMYWRYLIFRAFELALSMHAIWQTVVSI